MRKRMIRAAIATVLFTVLMAVIFGSFVLIPAGTSSLADLSYRSLDYDVNVTGDGNLEVTQHIDMKLRKRADGDDNVKPWKQLYQQYTLRADNLTDITDISVTNVTTGTRYAQQSEPKVPSDVPDSVWDSDYANHWYIADVDAGGNNPRAYVPGEDGLTPGQVSDYSKTVEIGWNIPVTESADSLKFDVHFTMHDVATQWDDIAAFQWEPFGKSNQVPIGVVSGTVHFPEGITKNTSWGWLHTERTSETSRAADGGLTFKAYNIRSGDYLDVVAAWTSAPNGSGIARTLPGDHLDALKADETRQEQQWRDRQHNAAVARLTFWVISVTFGIALVIWGLYASIISNRNARYHGPIEYWRDKPGISPASAARLLDVMEQGRRSRSNRQLTATMLALAVKKAITIYPGPAEMYRGIDMSRATALGVSHMIDRGAVNRQMVKTTSTIVIMPEAIDQTPNQAQFGLSDSENALLKLLVVISKRVGSPVFDFNQMKAACEDWEDGYIELGKFTGACDIEYTMLDVSRARGWQWILAGTLAAIDGFAIMLANLIIGYAAVGLILGLPIFAMGIFCATSGSMQELTKRGQEYAGRVLGLKRYMEDFSDFSDRGAADLALWDWYMVYAAAFGISDRVAAEFAKAYPQVNDPRWLDDNASDSVLYWSYRSHMWDERYYGGGYGAGSAGSAGFGAGSLFGGNSYASDFSDLGTQLSSGLGDITSTIQAAMPSSDSGGGSSFGGSGGSFSGGGFGGSAGGSGGGSFGGR